MASSESLGEQSDAGAERAVEQLGNYAGEDSDMRTLYAKPQALGLTILVQAARKNTAYASNFCYRLLPMNA